MSGTLPAPPADSRRSGFLSPDNTDADDASLDAILQAWLVGITGLPGSYVRPRWQPIPGPQPDQDVNWCAIGVTSLEADFQPAFVHDETGDTTDPLTGTSIMQRHEAIEAAATFYGPDAVDYAALARDSAQVGQNRDVLAARKIWLVGTGTIRVVPEVVGQIWLRRADLDFAFRREVIRLYPIRTLVAAPVALTNDPT